MSSHLISRDRDARRAFTLIELLTVMAIVGILAGLTFGAVRGVRERAKISLCRTELSTIAAALETYKRQYGDYPQIRLGADHVGAFAVPTAPTIKDAAYDFFRALGGFMGPTGDFLKKEVSAGVFKERYGKTFVDFTKFKLERTKSTDDPSGKITLPEPDAILTNNEPDFVNAILDPWGNRYVYFYKVAGTGTWKNPTFVLMSAGPDGYIKWDSGTNPIPASGIIDSAFYTATETTGSDKGKGNPDNIYLNR